MNPIFPFATAITLLVFLSPLPTLNAVVLDTDGEDVRNSGGSYYIIPKGSSNGLTLTQRPGSPSCPLYITQITTSPGTSVTISALVRTLFIPVSARVNIVFNTDVATCADPLEWHVTPDLATGKSYVTAGGGSTVSSYRFSIEQAGNGEKDNIYKIRYCPSAEEDETNCGDVGFLGENGLLGINNENPLFVQFKKVNTGMSEIV
ncbi:hypothetical protein SOVF_103530 [Spinacia oleracea]|uniref:Trypsin inhibitor BvTI-like n=1 Tax=Spinacia oleracea TaxID=3562 RepID=A0ABM3QIR6_SPIOL|nr:trypsin inhibitor BvTI-like [Spinacia oleracea]KNA14861.1 hypothetical protein SOVF_103530 [Spinacia oleracea]